VSDDLSAPLKCYRVLTTTAKPLAPLLLARRLKRGKEDPQRVSERRGESRIARPPGSLVWLHSASVGELLSALPLVEQISARNITVLVTSGTVTSTELAARRLPRGAIHQFIPVDIPAYVRQFLDHWQPDLALFVESELWPNIIIESSRRGVPMILINGRMSENSFRKWSRFPATIGNLLQRFDLCLARTQTDAQRLIYLGAPEVLTAGNLKLDVPPLPADPTKLKDLEIAIGRRPILAAASTHEGEEEILISAHRRLREDFPGLLTIIVPRHPERGPAIAELAQASALEVTVRSAGELPKRSSEIYVADTLGELGLFYRLAPVVFVGGSLVSHGGQNPIEAAKLGAAVLHGPHVWNFSEIYAELDSVLGAKSVNEEELVSALSTLLASPDLCKRMAEAGKSSVDSLGGAFERTLHSINPYLMQLQLRQRADHA
jgi:3-deoxy-D-manno-octulosonic-acid transferase